MERERVELNERDFEELAIRLTAIKKSCEKERPFQVLCKH